MLALIYGRKSLQLIYKKLYSFALKGLNYGIVGSGEIWALNYIKRNSDDLKVILDVGANIGEYSLQLRETFGNTPQIHAFEPVKSTFRKLQENCKTSRVVCHNFGLGDGEESITFYFNPSQHTFASKFKRNNSDVLQSQEITVDIKTLDSFCSDEHINYIDFLKLDVEGNEYNTLKGAEKMLSAKLVKYIQFEFGGTSLDARIYFRDFWELLNPNYKIYRILKDGLDEVKEYHVRNEVFYYANYLAEIKSDK